LSTALFTLVIGWCTSQTECWTVPADPAPQYATLEECREALPGRAREVLLPHFKEHHLDVTLSCDRAQTQTAERPGETAPR
jgi:hypothetical protein